MPRALWNGAIRFGLVSIPIKLRTAVRDHTLGFHYLHRKDQGRVRYERVCEVCGEHVDWKDLVRGYEQGREKLVVLTEEEVESIRPEAEQTIDILQFVHERELSRLLFDVPYYVDPDKRGGHAYLLLRDALRKSEKVGIARVVLRTREHLAALEVIGERLVLETMRWPDELLEAGSVEAASGRSAPAEMKMALSLIDSMTDKFAPETLHDRYRERLSSLIAARAKGHAGPIDKARPQPATNVIDLAGLLQKSIEAKRKRSSVAKHARPGRRRTSAA